MGIGSKVLILLAALSEVAWTTSDQHVAVTNLTINGRHGVVLDIDDRRPTLSWQIVQSVSCSEGTCPADYQTAYRLQTAATENDLTEGHLTWDSGRVESNLQSVRFERDLQSRQQTHWRVQVWDANNNTSAWSPTTSWSMGLLRQSDWGEARWIDYPDRLPSEPLPLFVRQFEVGAGRSVERAILYLSGVGLHHATINGKDVSDEVLAPGYSNHQLSSEYHTYDIKEHLSVGANALGIALGHGPAFVRRDITNSAVGRNAPYAWWQSQLKGNGTLAEVVEMGATAVVLSNVTGYHVGGTINVDTGAGGSNLESRVIDSIDNTTNVITFSPGLNMTHDSGVKVTGSGNNIAETDPSAGAAVTPRVIGRLEITYTDGSSDAIVTDRSWRASLGPLVLDQWYSGSDYDARREHDGWDRPGATLDEPQWVAAGLAPPPNLATQLVSRAAEPVKIHEQFVPVNITNPVNGTWVFDFGQNFAGWAVLSLPEMQAGVTIRVSPSESLFANGTVDQSSLGPGSRGSDLFYTYTTAGKSGGESWHPLFNYFGMQWVQVTGLPEGFTPGPDLITGLRLQGDVPVGGNFTSSDERVNRIHKMASYSFMSNLLSVFTDCPGREKLSYPADYTMPMGAIFRHFNLGAFMRTTMRTLVEGQSVADSYMFGNVALKTPVYDWGYTRRFGDEINWGNAIVLVPSLLHDLYGETSVMEANYDRMKDFVDYIRREKARGNIVEGALADWVAADERTSTNFTGTWGYYLTIKAMSRMANLTNHADAAAEYAQLATQIGQTFQAEFYNDECGCYTTTGNNSTLNATQASQAMAIDAGLVPAENMESVFGSLVNLTENYNSSGPHLSGGTIALSSIVRALTVGGQDELLWQTLQENDYPGYGYFLQPTEANPNGFTTIGERWNGEDSKNHMILAQIDEWFHSTIAGIRPLALSTFSTLWEPGLVFEPRVVGTITSAAGTYNTPKGEARSSWTLSSAGIFALNVTVPANTVAEVRVPSNGAVTASSRAKPIGKTDGYTSFTVPSGHHSFSVSLAA